ncbi:adhesion G-protein coupled receptor G5 isoform X3 [Aquila chrysaetos chrysaetos]|uniref:adhesion G-protein coupled receptor G5 isoform X3 n=1 Tax=Aquila chrysaetos chrysaetos TaxID=223781 RepID=UPI001B7D39F1|nr:adhesion G-protein coupled receptor G5 isoform X3 [Aquila chrysaetos chrysaetos]
MKREALACTSLQWEGRGKLPWGAHRATSLSWCKGVARCHRSTSPGRGAALPGNSDCSGQRSLPAGQGRFCRQGCLPESWDPPLGTWEQRPSEGAHQGWEGSRWERLPYLHICRQCGRDGAATGAGGCCGATPDVKRGGGGRLRHAMNFPVELMEGIKARGVEQKLVCIYIHSPCIFQDVHNNSVLNDDVLGAFLRSGHVAGLSRPVEIQFWHDMVLDASNATCVFWQPGAGVGSTGSWSREGCETMHREGTVICHCNHLTYFAVLLVPAGTLSPAQLASLTHISTIGCSLSAAATLCTLLLCCFSRQRLRDSTTKIHMHLLAALLLLNCSFLLSTPLATGPEGLCRATAALLHASLLCTLAWMAAEAFHLILLLVKVYNVYIQHYLLKLCLFAWGLPTLAVVAVFVFKRDTYGYHTIHTSEGYSNATMCWLTSPPAYSATLCYAGLILLFNMLVLGRVVMILRSIRRQKGQARKDWATVLGLTCLLGTTWGLAFFSFGIFLVPQLYLFTILNSLQGLSVCLWYITVHRRSKLGPVSSTSRYPDARVKGCEGSSGAAP